MAFGIIKADTLTHSTAGSVTTNNVVNGSAKHWANLNGDGTIALRDSFNTASATDGGLGDYSFTFTNNMSDTNYLAVGAISQDYASSNDIFQVHTGSNEEAVPTTSTYRNATRNNNGNSSDNPRVNAEVLGDLA